MRKFKIKNPRHIFIVAVISTLCILLTSCAGLNIKVHGQDLMKGIKSEKKEGKEVDTQFISNLATFSLKLFKDTLNEAENSLVSPLSVMLALGMTANGASESTLKQMQKTLGGEITLSDLNKYLYTYTKGLNSSAKSKLEIANSIWVSDNRGLLVNEDFLQTNANYYDAGVYKSQFDDQTLKDINNWVKNKTDGMIKKIIDEISDDALMYLINAIVFDAKWENAYKNQDLRDGDFYAINKEVQTVQFMKSQEKEYLEGDNFTGFIKPYINEDYSFVALLPNENITLDELIKSIDGNKFIKIIKERKDLSVQTFLPKFTYDYEISLNKTLKLMGMEEAFDPLKANFSRIGKSEGGNIFIDKVLHKTFISVDDNGTKAGAVTIVSMNKMAAPEEKTVRLDRPFVYSIIDNKTGIPIFLGALRKVKS